MEIESICFVSRCDVELGTNIEHVPPYSVHALGVFRIRACLRMPRAALCARQAPEVAVLEAPWWMLKVEGYLLDARGELLADRRARHVLGNLVRRIVVHVDPAAIEPVRKCACLACALAGQSVKAAPLG